MQKVRSFFSGLQRSTVITLISCACFIFMTLLILMFFVLFPITPSERVADRLGRESVFRSSPENNAVAAEVTTDVNEPAAAYEQTVTTTAVSRVTTTHTEYTITITSGSGFLYSGYIPTGIYPGEGTYTTEPAEPWEEPIEDPTDEPGLLDPTEDPSLIDPTEDPSLIDPTGPVDEPGIGDDPGVVTDPPAVTPEPTPTPEDPASGGTPVNEW